jgi:hypothetical protein
MTGNVQYIYYISLVIECLVFGLIIIGIKRTGQITSEDSQGLNWFSYAFFSWAITGVVSVFALMYKIGEKNTYLLVGHTICSTFTSLCFIKTISYIKISSPYRGEKSIKAFFTNGMLVLFTFVIVILTIVISILEKDNAEQSKINWIWVPDYLFSIISLGVFGIVTGRAYKERELKHFIWFIWVTVVLIFIGTLFHLIGKTEYPFFNDFKEIVIKTISPIYKMFLFIMILLLIYSYQILGYRKITQENIELNEQFLFSKSEKDKIVEDIESLKIKDLEDQSEINHLHEIIEDYKKQYPALIYDSIDFSISSGNYSIILTNIKSKQTKEIPFSPSLEPFKRLLRLAIYHKYGNGQELQTLPYTEDGLPKSKNERSLETKSEYFSRFRPRDRTDIKIKAMESGYPGFTVDFLKLYKDYKPHRIGFTISPENIYLPPLKINDSDTPEEIYSLFVGKYTILKKGRG